MPTPPPCYNIWMKKISNFFYHDKRSAILWLIVRIYVGYEWLSAGWEKLFNPNWIGGNAGVVVKSFLINCLSKVGGAHPDVSGWYAFLVSHIAVPCSVILSYLVVFGEIFVGIALILGIFTGVAAFFGSVMNFNYMLAGSLSINPTMFLLEIFLILAWRVSGWFGFDRFIAFINKNTNK